MKKHNKKLIITVLKITTLVVTLVLGISGFGYYYIHMYSDSSAYYIISRTFYSSIRLFAAAFDLDYGPALEYDPSGTLIVILEIAKWLAIFLTGHIIFRLVSPILTGLFIKIRGFIWKKRASQVLIVGCNEDNKTIYRSVKKPMHAVLLASSIEECNSLSNQGIKAVTASAIAQEDSGSNLSKTERSIKKALSKAVKTNKECTIIINTQNDKTNLHICTTIIDWLNSQLAEHKDRIENNPENSIDDKKYIVSVLKRIRVCVFGSREYQAVYRDLQEDSMGILKYINKYEQTAFDFVNKYPLTEFFSKEDYENYISNGCVAKELDFNMIFIGFGENNQEIFLSSFANNQFVENSDGNIPQLKKVNYHIFDKSGAANSKSLNHTIFRYQNEFINNPDLNRNDYFDTSDFPANVSFHSINADDVGFYGDIRNICLNNKSSVNFVVIGIGSDLENMDIAQRLAEKKLEWGYKNIHIFAKVRTNDAYEIRSAFAGLDYYTFGNEDKHIYNYSCIVNDSYEELAIKRDLMYDYENNRKNNHPISYDDLGICAEYDWYVNMACSKRLSNIHSVLSFRMKLQLLGLDYREKDSCKGSFLQSNDDYFDVYAGSNAPSLAIPCDSKYSKDIYSYDALPLKEDFCKNISRYNLTVQEHYRWNAFMISCGFVPKSKESTFESGTKNYATRTHSNLCSFEGLFDFRKELALHRNTSEEAEDVIKYDYQLMDDAWWFLESKNLGIYKRYSDSE